jgi:hypothetical protein
MLMCLPYGLRVISREVIVKGVDGLKGNRGNRRVTREIEHKEHEMNA